MSDFKDAEVRSPVGWQRSRFRLAMPVALIVVSIIPLFAGTLRLIQLAGGPAILPADPRFAHSPAPLVVHIVGAALYALVGILQFLPTFRRRHRSWHRRIGRLLVVVGILVAGSAVWMTLFYTRKPGTGEILYFSRLLSGTVLAVCLVLGVSAVRRGQIAAHRAWMIRAYAIAVAAGTQVLTEGLSRAIFGPGELRDDLAKVSAWVINLAIAEWMIRRPGSGRPGAVGKRAWP